MTVKILAFAGSTRNASYNKQLVTYAVELLKEQGAEVTHIDLADYPMPLYDGDLEEKEGLPNNAYTLRDLFKQHQGLLLACPEYNSSITAVLKNTIDWVSRPQPNEEDLICFKGKICTLLSASPGGLGGLRGLVTVRSILGNIGCVVLPQQVAIPSAFKAFEQGQLIDDRLNQALTSALQDLVDYCNKVA